LGPENIIHTGLASGSKADTVKIPRIGYALLILLVAGIMLMTHTLTQQEARGKLRDFQNKGAYLVNLMALYHIGDYETPQRSLLMRTISENISSEGFLYLFVHNGRGKAILSMAPSDLAAQIPREVETAALFSQAMTKQSFKVGGNGHVVYEFAKPVYEGGKKAGTIRLGLSAPLVPFFSLERTTLVALMTFFVLAALILGYYGVLVALKPLRILSRKIPEEEHFFSGPAEAQGHSELLPVIEGMEESLLKVQAQLQQIKNDNLSLSSRLGVITFEKNQIAAILDAISFGIIVINIHNNVVLINNSMLKLLGKEKAELMDRPLARVLPYPEILSYVSQHDDTLRPVKQKPVEMALPDLVAPGEWFQFIVNYLAVGDQECVGKMISVRNVTADRIAEESKHKFIAHVVHELLTPLTNIKSYNEVLMDGEVRDLEMQRKFFNTINDETDRLANLIQSLMNISKMEMGSLAVNKQLVRTDWFAEGCLAAIEASARDKKLTIERRIPDVFPSLMADKELLRGAIINILGNALKYTQENGTITFVIADHSDAVVFEVIDTGYGIAPDDLPHIFERFYRSSQPHIVTQAGSGLGLAITAEIVRLHGGEIDVKSQLGEGTHVTIRIPKEEYYLAME